LSSRVRLALVAASVLLISGLLAGPEVSQAKPPATVKLFTAHFFPPNDTADGGVLGAWNETVHNCGSSDTDTPCNRASTIGLAFVRVAVPPAFQTTGFSVSIQSASGHHWTVGYDANYLVTAQAATGSDKLQAGESVVIHYTGTPLCTSGAQPFSTQAWGDFTFGDQFFVAGTTPPNPVATPTVTINGCALGNGDTATDETTHETVTVNGLADGATVDVSFGGNQADCSGDSNFGPQWSRYHLPTQVNISAPSTVGTSPKIFTFEFPQNADVVGGGDSSWYLICYQSDHSFTDRSGHPAVFNSDSGLYTGLLPDCYNPGDATHEDSTRAEPCVSEQSLIGSGAPPWTVSEGLVHISIRVPAGDPRAH
jgi:hypothetical protein